MLCFSLSLLVASSAVPTADLVSSLPGWDQKLPSQWFSGFLSVGQHKKLHYMLVEAEAPLDPKTAPLVLWLNGGPGCSSLEGFVYEHGPLVVSDAHAPPNINFDGKPSTNGNSSALVRNPWSWSRAANMLYLEAPAGVGFSYSTNKNDLNTGDNQTAADNLAALHSFYELFPNFKTNPFYVSGESYGGVYVPTLSQKIYQDATFPGKMTGYFVGNGVFDFEQAADTHVPFAYGHGIISTKLNTKIVKACDGNYLKPTAACEALIKMIAPNEINMNGYDAYRTCYHPTQGQNSNKGMPTLAEKAMRVDTLMEMSRHASEGNKGAILEWLRKLRENVPCINSVKGTEYLNMPSVKRALHVDTSPNSWSVCGGVDYNDDGVYKSIVEVHKQMIQFSPRVLVYNGDVDPGCNYLWAEASVEAFGLAVSQDWHPWVYADDLVGPQLGGYATNYRGNVTMATVHGAGHMSPQWRPEAAFTMFSRFLKEGYL
jgi:carboxypeptidase C (cathepsin A)